MATVIGVRLFHHGVPTEHPTAVLSGHTGQVEALIFSPDSRILASAGDDGTVRLWDTASHRQTASLLVGGTRRKVDALAFSPDGRVLAGTSEDSRLACLWDVATGKQISVIHDEFFVAVTGVTFSPDGRTLAVADTSGTTLRAWDVGTLHRLDLVPDVDSQTVTFSGATGNWEGNFILSTWSLPDGKRLAALRGGNLGGYLDGGLSRADALAFDVMNRPVPGRRPAMFGFQDSQTHRPAASLTSISWMPSVVVFNENGHLGAVGELTGLPHIDDLVHHRQLTKISGASNLPTPIAFSPTLLRASVLVAERARAAAVQARARLQDAERTAAELAALSAEARQVVAACVAQFRQTPIRDGIKPPDVEGL